MREEDKVLLFCELMGQDVSPHVNKYVEELRSSELFLNLCKNVAKARNINTYKSQRLIDEFECIDFSTIDTLQEYFILDAKINYLYTNSEATDYINPFFYNQESDSIITVGEISLFFDHHRFSLNDIILDERYTARYKVDYFKECYLDWRKEVREKVIVPLKSIAIEKDVVANIKHFDEEFIIYAWTTLALNIGFCLAPMISSKTIEAIYRGTSTLPWIQYLFPLIIFSLFIMDIYFVLTINYRLGITRAYRKAKRTLKNPQKILSDIDKQCSTLYEYILNGISIKKPLKKHIAHFALNDHVLAAEAYLLKAVELQDIQKQFKPNIHFSARILFFLIWTMILVMILIYLLWKLRVI